MVKSGCSLQAHDLFAAGVSPIQMSAPPAPPEQAPLAPAAHRHQQQRRGDQRREKEIGRERPAAKWPRRPSPANHSQQAMAPAQRAASSATPQTPKTSDSRSQTGWAKTDRLCRKSRPPAHAGQSPAPTHPPAAAAASAQASTARQRRAARAASASRPARSAAKPAMESGSAQRTGRRGSQRPSIRDRWHRRPSAWPDRPRASASVSASTFSPCCCRLAGRYCRGGPAGCDIARHCR